MRLLSSLFGLLWHALSLEAFPKFDTCIFDYASDGGVPDEEVKEKCVVK